MNLKILKFIIFLVLSAFASLACAEDLAAIYKEALHNDQIFKAAEAQFLAAKENLPINYALLLPNIQATGFAGRNYQRVDGLRLKDSYYYNGAGYGLTLAQPVFNYNSWATVQNASSLVKQAEAQYFFAIQDLILRTATGYFSVLEARDVLQLARAQKKSLERRLKEEKQRYEVGLIPITNVYEIKANYDKTSAQEIAAENDLSNKIEKLREIIGKPPGNLAVLGVNLPVNGPVPQDISQWMRTSEKQNYSLLAANYSTIAARDNIKMQFGNHLPTVTAQGSYQFSNTQDITTRAPLRTAAASLSLNVALPVYSGGATSAKVRQAEDNYNKASANQEFTHRDVIMQTRQAYLGIIDAISKMSADKQAIISNNGSLKALEAQYHYGTRTMADVLNQETALYQSQRDYALDQYNYIKQTLTLKQAAGTLSGDDLMVINGWLHQGEISENERIIGISENKSTITSLEATDYSKARTTDKAAKYDTAAESTVAHKSVHYSSAASKKSIMKSKSKLSKQSMLSTSNSRDVSNQKLASSQGTEVHRTVNHGSHYVLQIAASGDKYQATSLVHKYSSLAKMQCIVEEKDGRVVYKVIAGDYPSLGAAIAAKDKFAHIGVEGWVRVMNN